MNSFVFNGVIDDWKSDFNFGVGLGEIIFHFSTIFNKKWILLNQDNGLGGMWLFLIMFSSLIHINKYAC